MEYRRLGKSGLKVSEIGLGTNAFGGRADEQTSVKAIEQALALGINFIDTADIYNQGRSEEIVGKAVKGKRMSVIIATKFGNTTGIGRGGSRDYFMKAVEASLRRLNTDYIDLYYLHRPDPETPIEETLRAFNDLVRAGKVRYIACSNFASWQLCEAIWTSKVLNLESFVAEQSRYNIFDRSIEQELVPCCQTYGVGIVPWGPLASGMLTGNYGLGKAAAKDTRLATRPPIYRDLMTDSNFDKLVKLDAFAVERGHSIGDLAIAWLLSHQWLSSVISGVTKAEQVSTNAASANWKLTKEDIDQLHKIL